MAEVNEKVLEKVRKALNLADPTKNNSPEEAQAAMLMAQKLMAKYGIEMSEVEFKEAPEKEAVLADVMFTKRYVWWYGEVARVIANNFRCRVLLGTYKKVVKSIQFVGLKDDVATAREVLKYAIVAIQYHADKFARRQHAKGIPMAGLRDEFARGFIKGLSEAFAEQVNKEGWGLILARDALVDQKFEQARTGTINLNLKQAFHPTHGDVARAAGYEQGKNFYNTKRLED